MRGHHLHCWLILQRPKGSFRKRHKWPVKMVLFSTFTHRWSTGTVKMARYSALIFRRKDRLMEPRGLPQGDLTHMLRLVIAALKQSIIAVALRPYRPLPICSSPPWHTVTYWECSYSRIVDKSLDMHSKVYRFEPHCGVFFWYGPLASLSFQIASVGSDHHGKKWRSQQVD